MHYNHAHAAKGNYGGRNRHLYARSMERAAINIYKTDSSYEMLVFAPGRIKEHFHLDVKGTELTVSYMPPEDFPQFNWVSREYSRGGFRRTVSLDETINTAAITAKYTDGVLQVSLPVIPGKEVVTQEIQVG